MGGELDICNCERFNRKRIILLVYWMYSILKEDEFGVSRDELTERLEERGIETEDFLHSDA